MSLENILNLPVSPGYGSCDGRDDNINIQMQFMFYFDNLSLQCKSFVIAGCQGLNDNKFRTKKECDMFSQASACEEGEIPLYTDYFGSLQFCQSTCPYNYNCRFDNIFRRYICCGYSNERQECPKHQLPYMSLETGSALPCNISNSFDSCPQNFVCTQKMNMFSSSSFCCSPGPAKSKICPIGRVSALAHKDDSSTSVIKCSILNHDYQCPSREFECVMDIQTTRFGFCCSTQVNEQGICNGLYLKNALTKKGEVCEKGNNDLCPQNYSCSNVKDPQSKYGLCCATNTTKVIAETNDNIPNQEIENNQANHQIKNSQTKNTHNEITKSNKEIKKSDKEIKTVNTTSAIKSTKKLGPLIVSKKWIKSKDPLCPYVSLSKPCKPSTAASIDDCSLSKSKIAVGAFCQFNIQYQTFSCCAFAKP
uniref:BPTI/Kunitz inhibitor domain-containing protein n=1 Tax=Rhabditophanes sp. KR3021 TaxID=114890 RepID=A0AC35TTD9_9BILA